MSGTDIGCKEPEFPSSQKKTEREKDTAGVDDFSSSPLDRFFKICERSIIFAIQNCHPVVGFRLTRALLLPVALEHTTKGLD